MDFETHTHTYIGFQRNKRGHEFEKEHGGIYGSAYRKEGEMISLLCYQRFIIQSKHCISCDFFLKKISNQILTKYWWIEERSKITNCCRETKADFSAQ